MSEDIKILSSRRQSFEKGRLQNMRMPLEVHKQTNGTYVASVRGQEKTYSATGGTESDALYAVKQIVKGKMLSGDFTDVNQRMI